MIQRITPACCPRISSLFLITASLMMTGCESDNDNPTDPTGTDPTEALIEPGPNEAILYYLREDSGYDGWGLHLWNTESCTGAATPTEWGTPLLPDSMNETYGAYYRIPVTDDGDCLNFIMHQGDNKDLGGNDHQWHFNELGRRIFTLSGSNALSVEPVSIPSVAIEGASAHWIDTNTLVWDDVADVNKVELRYDGHANIRVEDGALVGGTTVELSSSTMTQQAASQFPHLTNWLAYNIDLSEAERTSALKGQLIAAAYNKAGKLTHATRVQIPGALDATYTYDGPLGSQVTGSGVEFSVWAPTAQSVRLHAFDANKQLLSGFPVAMTPMTGNTGVWHYTGSLSLDRAYYQYEVTAYHPETDAIETAVTSDPYALSLSTNGEYAQVVNLDDADLKPTGWTSVAPPAVSQPEDLVIYETHIRDFSASDTSVAPDQRGKYAAFSATGSAGLTHLTRLANAGVTHIHLLPAFDIATVNEDPAKVVDIDDDFSRLCALSPTAADQWADQCDSGTIRSALENFDPASGDAQALYSVLRSLDSFNWGYDPQHYTVPEGSYSSDAEGVTRIIEFRAMIKSLTDMGFNVVMDVVYNHTNASGLAEKSVLDKIVPGYYHRLNPQTGAVEQSTCCENTATEHRMMAKLMTDSLSTWAEQYKVSGFRFDLMGHHMLSNITDALAAVQAIDPDTYFYGEGWNFGEVADNARGVNAIQKNLGGSGIGSFNDRSRDGVRGGGPFDSGEALRQNQGFANGLYTYPNELNTGSGEEKQSLFKAMDWIRAGIAGGLASYPLETFDGTIKTGAEIDYNGQAAGYTADPQELINYASKHDNQTLWDNNQYKAPSAASSRDRARMQVVALAIPILSEGIPFLHMGSEILRSKSMQRDSYDSGDWFNAIDFSYQTSTWNRGLPRADKDSDNWPVITPILADSEANPSTADRLYTRDAIETLLRIRKQSALFRLTTAEQVEKRLAFHNTGPQQLPGVIAFSLDDGTAAGNDIDSNSDALMVVINASPAPQTLQTNLTGFEIHREMPANGASFTNGNFEVPGLSVAVFEQSQSGAQGAGLAATIQ
ncbi:pullulanase-type alpha-1,6-glucosidase [Marinobacter sp. 1Y8]